MHVEVPPFPKCRSEFVTVHSLSKLALSLLALLVWMSIRCETGLAQFGALFGGGPKLETIDTQSLNDLIVDQKRRDIRAQNNSHPAPVADFVVVDVRSPREFSVSVIPGAITKAQYEKDVAKYRGRLVIPYCTVGARSGNYARQLAKKGVKVKNYKGSILGWVHAGLPLVTLGGSPTKRVHTYSDNYRVPETYQQVTD